MFLSGHPSTRLAGLTFSMYWLLVFRLSKSSTGPTFSSSSTSVPWPRLARSVRVWVGLVSPAGSFLQHTSHVCECMSLCVVGGVWGT